MREFGRLPRNWVVNVVATVGGAGFDEWVRSQVSKRNERISEKRQLYVELDPQIAAAFQKSEAISGKYLSTLLHLTFFLVHRGSGAMLLKGSGRRRTKAELDMEREAGEEKEAQLVRQERELQELA